VRHGFQKFLAPHQTLKQMSNLNTQRLPNDWPFAAERQKFGLGETYLDRSILSTRRLARLYNMPPPELQAPNGKDFVFPWYDTKSSR
jgi:hypothetical protein